jgi:hypothetical protein
MGAPRHATSWAQLTEAALEYASASSEDDLAFLRARDRLRKAAVLYREAHAPDPRRPPDPATLAAAVEAAIG